MRYPKCNKIVTCLMISKLCYITIRPSGNKRSKPSQQSPITPDMNDDKSINTLNTMM